MASSKRIGPRMAEVAEYVRDHPGEPMIRSAEVVAPHGSLNYGYRTVHRAIDAGIVRLEWEGHRSKLYPVEDS